MQTSETLEYFEQLLTDELIVAMGCTEPIAVALCAAKTHDLLDGIPEKITALCSGNVIKNVKSVTIPNSGGGKGIRTAVAMGAVIGQADKGLEILDNVSSDELEKVNTLLDRNCIDVQHKEQVDNLYVEIVSTLQNKTARAVISGKHNHFIHLSLEAKETKNTNSMLTPSSCSAKGITPDYYDENNESKPKDRSSDVLQSVSIAELMEIAATLAERKNATIMEAIKRQIDYNYAIALEGIKNPYGAQIGRTIIEKESIELQDQMVAYAAAGSDARMNGCSMPVVIISGSGNQGITASVPLIIYARKHGYSDEDLYRALLFSDILTLYQKSFIGRLSAFCGVVSASAAAVASIAYLEGQGAGAIGQIVANAISTAGGMVCDGAKSSCAAKIASSLYSAFLAKRIVEKNRGFQAGEGLVSASPETTIRCIGKVACDGMAETDITIMKIMIEES